MLRDVQSKGPQPGHAWNALGSRGDSVGLGFRIDESHLHMTNLEV